MALDLDFYNMKIVARIQKAEGVESVVGPRPGLLDRPPDTRDEGEVLDTIFKSLSRLTVDEGIGYTTSVALDVEPPLESALDFLDSEYLRFGNILHVRFGYQGGNSESLTRYAIMQQPDVSLGSESTISIPAFGWGHPMMRNTTGGKSEGNKSVRSLVNEFAQRYRLEVKEFEVTKEYTSRMTESLQAEMSDFEYLKELVEATSHYLILSSNEVIVMGWGVTGQRPTATFRLYGPISFGDSIFPIFDFTFQSGALFLPNFARGLATRNIDRDTGEVKTSESNQKNSIARGGVQAGPSVPALSNNPTEASPGGQSNAKAQLAGGRSIVPAKAFREGGDKQFWDRELDGWADQASPYAEIEFGTLGNPFIFPGSVIRVELPKREGGNNRILTGNYLVFGVQHILGPGGYETRISARTKAAFNANTATTPLDPKSIQKTSLPVGRG